MDPQAASLKLWIAQFTAPFKKPLTAAQARSLWHTHMPESVRKRTAQIYVRDHTIFLKITSATLKHALQLKQGPILTLFQEAMPDIGFKAVVFL